MLSTNSLLKEIAKLEVIERIKVTVTSSLKYGALVGGVTVISGILGGPVGLMAGGIISSCVAGLCAQGEFQSASYILLYETTPEQKNKLAKLVINEYLKFKHITTIRDFILNVSNNAEMQEAIVKIIITFLVSELNANICVKN